MKRRPWRPQITRPEAIRGWVFFALYVGVFPLLMGAIQRGIGGEIPVAEANVLYYLVSAVLVFLVFWSFLRHGFHMVGLAQGGQLGQTALTVPQALVQRQQHHFGGRGLGQNIVKFAQNKSFLFGNSFSLVALLLTSSLRERAF